MLHFFTNSSDPAASRSACRLWSRKGQQGWTELRGEREAENDQRQMSNVILFYSVVGLEDGGVTLRETLAGGWTIRHRGLRFILQLYSCQMLQKGGASWSRPVLYIVWKASFQWRDVYYFLVAATWEKMFTEVSFFIKTKTKKKLFPSACCNKPWIAWGSNNRQPARHMELCWCVWLLSPTCNWTVSSSWCNKAACRPSLLLSIADHWKSLLTAVSLCSMISN